MVAVAVAVGWWSTLGFRAGIRVWVTARVSVNIVIPIYVCIHTTLSSLRLVLGLLLPRERVARTGTKNSSVFFSFSFENGKCKWSIFWNKLLRFVYLCSVG